MFENFLILYLVFLCTAQKNQFLLFPFVFLNGGVVKNNNSNKINLSCSSDNKITVIYLSLPNMYTSTAMNAYSYGTLGKWKNSVVL